MARYTENDAKAFIEYIAPIIKAEADKRGYKIISTTIAQAIIEGACGKSKLSSPPYNNHFGLKAGSKWMQAGKPAVNMKTGEEYTVGHVTMINDWFRSYPEGDESCVAGYYDFISSSRYANLKTAKDFEEFATFLKKDGYATSSTYVKTLCNTVRKYGLYQWDDVHIEYFPMLIGYRSIVDALENLGVDSSFEYRKKIHNANFSTKYMGTAVQNNRMLTYLSLGKLKKPL